MSKFLLSAVILASSILSAPVNAADPVTINFWHYQNSNREVLTQTIKEFEAANPGVKVQELFKDLTNLATEIQAARMVGRAPDVAQVLARLTM